MSEEILTKEKLVETIMKAGSGPATNAIDLNCCYTCLFPNTCFDSGVVMGCRRFVSKAKALERLNYGLKIYWEVRRQMIGG